MALFDAEGKEVEGSMTKEEVEAATKTAVEAATAKAVEDYKLANPTPVVEPKVEKKEEVVAPKENPLDPVVSRLDRLERERLADRYVGTTDMEKRDQFLKSYGQISGFEDTEEGTRSRAEAAMRMSFGSVDPGVNVADLGGTSGGRNVDTSKAPAQTEADKIIQKALNISAADVEKFGPKPDEKK